MDISFFDRFLFAFTIGSHIIIVGTSVSLGLLLVILEFLYARKNREEYEYLIKRIKKMFIVAFGIGTASGIVMAVELVNLFPNFMKLVSETGAINLFYAEVSAFFLETITLMIYAYYENAFRWKYSNFLLSLGVYLGVIMSAVFITMVNAWMNTPNGFNINYFETTGNVKNVAPFAPFFTSSTIDELEHVLTTTIFAGVVLTSGMFAYVYLRSNEEIERRASALVLRISAWISIITIALAGITGGNEVISLLKYQPEKYAAIELNPVTGSGFSEHIFGYLNNGIIYGSLKIPGLQAFLAKIESGITTLPGLSSFPRSTWPPLFVHTSFDIMVVGGLLMGLFFFIFFLYFIRRRDFTKNHLIVAMEIPLAFIAYTIYELGWVTDEVGRQPWIVYNVMKVSEAESTSTAIILPGYFIIAFYLIVIPLTFYIMFRIFRNRQDLSLNKKSNVKEGVYD